MKKKAIKKEQDILKKYQAACDDETALADAMHGIEQVIYGLEPRRKSCPEVVKALNKCYRFVQKCQDEAEKDREAYYKALYDNYNEFMANEQGL